MRLHLMAFACLAGVTDVLADAADDVRCIRHRSYPQIGDGWLSTQFACSPTTYRPPSNPEKKCSSIGCSIGARLVSRSRFRSATYVL